MRRTLGLLVCVAVAGCVDYLEPGQVGEIRYFGEVRGTDPLPLFPPISDREGNAYVLSGARDQHLVTVFTGQAGGGWSSGCSLHKGDSRGAHGWVGRTRDHAWYWSGNGLVDVSGETGSCTFVLDRDPATTASINFLGVVPSVRDAPSRTTVVALIQTPNDPVPYWILVDLRTERYTQLRRFEPSDATNVVVLGTGATDEAGAGVMVVHYVQNGAAVVEARYLDAEANELGTAKLTNLDTALEDDVLGFVSLTSSGLGSAILADGSQLTFDTGGGTARTVSAMMPVGVHLANDHLWMVGTNAGEPVVAPIGDDGSVGGVTAWTASQRTQTAITQDLQVIDDRASPRRYLTWPGAQSAIGTFPFESSQTPHVYAQDTTLWLLAGPSYTVGGEQRTQIALAPIGITYP